MIINHQSRKIPNAVQRALNAIAGSGSGSGGQGGESQLTQEMIDAIAHIQMTNLYNVEIETSDWEALTSLEYPYLGKAMATIDDLGVDGTLELLNNNAILFAKYGFAIGYIEGKQVAIYSFNIPTENVILTLRYSYFNS